MTTRRPPDPPGGNGVRPVRGAWKTPAVVVRAPDGTVLDRPTGPGRRTGGTAAGPPAFPRSTAKAPRRHDRTGPPPGAPGGVLVTVRAAPGSRNRSGRYSGQFRPERPSESGPSGPSAGDRRRPPRRVPNLHLDGLAPVDEEARERRNARLRWLGTRVGSVALTGLLVYAVFPVRTYLNQRSDTDRAREQLEVLSEENDRLAQRAEELRDPETVEEIARRDHNLVMPGEEPYAIMPAPDQAPSEGDETDGG